MLTDPSRLATDTLVAVRTIESQMSSRSEAVLEKTYALTDPESREANLDAWRSALAEASSNVDQALAVVFLSDEAKLQDALAKTQIAQSATDLALNSLANIATTIGTVAKAVGIVGQVLADLP